MLASRNPFLFRGPIPTDGYEEKTREELGRNPFLFRGPIPTPWLYRYNLWLPQRRNPFLFRGPIPTTNIVRRS